MDDLTSVVNGLAAIKAAIGSSDIIRNGYAIANLPVGQVGQVAYVTDASSPTYLGTLTDGGSTVCPVFFDGTNWVSI